jgi:16S rRNA (guanine966-N2)-methyltransferase
MRIIAGTRKGARIAAPKGSATRPTGDRVREAAFNLIGSVEDAVVLDLYAGSGAMGLEALSRGARRCIFVESDRSACRVIEANLEKLRLTGAVVRCRDALAVLREDRAVGSSYDLVLVDPPYAEYASSLQMTLSDLLSAVLAPDGLVVLETSAKLEPELGLELVTSRRYGSSRLTLYRRHAP